MTKLQTVSDTIDKETRLLQLLDAAFSETAQARIDSYITQGATFRGPITGGVEVPMQEWTEFSLIVRGLVGDTSFAVTHKIEQGDWLTLRIRIRSKCLASGNTIEGFDCLLVRFEGDKIAEFIGHMDYLTFFEKLELVPPGALHACLSGQRLIWG